MSDAHAAAAAAVETASGVVDAAARSLAAKAADDGKYVDVAILWKVANRRKSRKP